MLLALLESEACFGPERVAEGGPPDADRVEDRRLDDDVVRVRSDLRLGATHHAGDADRTVRVRDDQRVRRELANDVVERLQALTLAGESHDDPSVVDGRGVERVDRLAELQHHVVADVDDVAHRSLPGGQQPHLDLVRRRTDSDATDAAADEPGAQVGFLDIDPEPLGDGWAGLDRVRLRESDGRSGDGRYLARQADEAQRVAPIGLDVDVEHDVAVEIGQGRAERCIGRQDEDPVRVGRETQFVTRAQHPVADDAHLLRCARSVDRRGAPHPGARRGRVDPTAMFVAPQTMSSASPSPVRTMVSDRRSAFGCFSTASSSPTTTFCQSEPQRSTLLTSMPSSVSRSASCSGVNWTST